MIETDFKNKNSVLFRLPQHIFQTAKVSKLLVAINKGKGIEYKGRALDDIQLSDTAETDDSDDDDERMTNGENQNETQLIETELFVSNKGNKNVLIVF